MVRRLLTPDRILTLIGAIAAAIFSVLHVASVAHADVRVHAPGDRSANAPQVRLFPVREAGRDEAVLAGAERMLSCPDFLIEIGRRRAHRVRVIGDPCKQAA